MLGIKKKQPLTKKLDPSRYMCSLCILPQAVSTCQILSHAPRMRCREQKALPRAPCWQWFNRWHSPTSVAGSNQNPSVMGSSGAMGHSCRATSFMNILWSWKRCQSTKANIIKKQALPITALGLSMSLFIVALRMWNSLPLEACLVPYSNVWPSVEILSLSAVLLPFILFVCYFFLLF